MDKDKFISLYKICFDDNGNIKACGRQACKNLLEFLNDDKYGDIKTYRLNIEEVNKLYREINV